MVVLQFEVYLVRLDPTKGKEMRKTRPCLIISPNEMNKNLLTYIAAPMTTVTKPYPSRVPVKFQNKKGTIVLDQIRTVDKERLVKRLGKIDNVTARKTLSVIQEMFAP